MADIFISYANEDRDTAAQLAAHLESAGWSVWWDRRIPAGRTWRAVLAEALVDTRCMIVLWSENSVESPWVAEEAEEARRLGKTLVPVLIRRVEPPIGFRTIQAANLTRWNGSADDAAILQLVADLKSLIGTPRERPAERHGLNRTRAFLHGFRTIGRRPRRVSSRSPCLPCCGSIGRVQNRIFHPCRSRIKPWRAPRRRV